LIKCFLLFYLIARSSTVEFVATKNYDDFGRDPENAVTRSLPKKVNLALI